MDERLIEFRRMLEEGKKSDLQCLKGMAVCTSVAALLESGEVEVPPEFFSEASPEFRRSSALSLAAISIIGATSG
jgi:hypothetical protein